MKLNDIKSLKSFHFIGIGGAGMSALAKILIESGLKVSGSDITESKATEDLKKLGAKIFIGHNEKNIVDKEGKATTEAIVCSTAIPPENPEIKKAAELKIPRLHLYEHFPEKF